MAGSATNPIALLFQRRPKKQRSHPVSNPKSLLQDIKRSRTRQRGRRVGKLSETVEVKGLPIQQLEALLNFVSLPDLAQVSRGKMTQRRREKSYNNKLELLLVSIKTNFYVQ